jgi:endoglucanase
MKLCLFSLLFIVFLSCDKKEMKIADGLIAINRNKSIGSGINLGNALEAPNEGEWGLVIQERFIDSIRNAGFNSVRIPICWSCHTDSEFPYEIDKSFLARIDQVVKWCIDRDLVAVITIHHFNDLYDYPDNTTYRNMLFSIWEQLTEHYKKTDCDKLIFEPLNEPHNNLTSDKWNQLIPEILQVIRSVDSSRTLILDVPDYGYHQSVTKLVIPEDEKNVIVSVRYYLPYEFTHQGAHWAEGSDKWLGNTWTGTFSEKNTVIADMDFIKTWAEANQRPITIGEWGSIIYCDNTSRLTWTEFIRSQIVEHDFSSTYFDFGVLFRAYDLENDHWLDGFKEALLED